MVSELNKILEELTKKRGEVDLFAIAQMDELVDRWVIIISAPWITADIYKDIFEEIRRLLVKHLSSEEVSSIARLMILDKDEHLTKELSQYMTGSVLDNRPINGNIFHQGRIIFSRTGQTVAS